MADTWLYLKRLYFISSGYSLLYFAVWQLLCWAFLVNFASSFCPKLRHLHRRRRQVTVESPSSSDGSFHLLDGEYCYSYMAVQSSGSTSSLSDDDADSSASLVIAEGCDDDDDDRRGSDGHVSAGRRSKKKKVFRNVNVVYVSYPADCCPKNWRWKYGCWAAFVRTKIGEKWWSFRCYTNRLTDHQYFESFVIFMIVASSLSMVGDG